MTKIPAKIQRSCFNASVGFVSDISSGRMDTNAEKKNLFNLLMPFIIIKNNKNK